MTEQPSIEDEARATVIRAALARAGLHLRPGQLAKLVRGHLHLQQGLEALRRRLDTASNPATVFQSEYASRLGGADENE